MPVKLNGSTSGYTQIQAAATAANNTLTLPNSGTNLLSDATLPTTTPTNGQIPIGNGTTYVPATITAGTGITVTNAAGAITIASTAAGGFANMQVFTSGTSTWTIPAGITACKITVIGGGGTGGNGFNSGCSNTSGGGGGGGGTAIKYFTGLTPANTLSYTVGAIGSTSSVSSGTQTISTISATGGSNGGAGTSSAFGAGGAGGLGAGGTLNIKGGGGAGGVTSLGGVGASSTMGGGGINGGVGGAYGGGGGGVATGVGANGSAGVIIIEY